MGQKDKFDPLYRTLVEGLVEARKASGLTQTDVAHRMGTDQSHVSKFERYERRLDVIDFIRYCRAVGANAPELLRRFIESSGMGGTY